MSGLFADLIKEQTTGATGTSTLTLGGALAGYQPFSGFYTNPTSLVGYAAGDGTNFEVGIGLYTLSGTTLARSRVIMSSNGGALVNFPSTVTVVNTIPAALLATRGRAAAFAQRMVGR